MQHPIDAMVQFDTNANAHANIDANVNGPLESQIYKQMPS